jgi:hypothetical protein
VTTALHDPAMNGSRVGGGLGRALSSVARRWRVLVLGLVALWVALVLHPQPLFAYSLRRQNLELHARQPLPPRTAAILDEAVRRLARSPLYDARQKYDVFLCDTASTFAFFTLKAGAAGVTHPGGNAFLRPANVAHDRLIDTAGRERQGERSLTYYIAHEAAHAMAMSSLGYLTFYRLARFQVEGYADHVAFDHRVDLTAGREALRRRAPEMDFARSGLYRKYELLVEYLLDRRGLSVEQLLAAPLAESEIERQLEADGELGAAGR